MDKRQDITTYNRSFFGKISDRFEIIKSKLNKNYLLNSKSPAILKEDVNLIIRTLENDLTYIDKIDLSIISNSEKGKIIFDFIFTNNISLDTIPLSWLKDSSILNEFVSSYLHNSKDSTVLLPYMKSHGISNEVYIDILSKIPKEEIQSKPEIIEQLISDADDVSLSTILEKIFNKEELQTFMENTQLPHNLSKLAELYSRDPRVLKNIDIRLLGEKYDCISINELHLFSRIPDVQSTLLNLSDYNLALFSRISKRMSSKTDNWLAYDGMILSNISNGNYSALLDDLFQEAKNGDLITTDTIDTLSLLLSSKNQNNTFNITTKEELDNYDSIRENVCNIIINNPDYDESELDGDIIKHLKNFKELGSEDRLKLALLQKYYCITFEEAIDIVNTFGNDISEIQTDSTEKQQVIEIVQAIRNICECDDISLLQEIGKMPIITQSDISPCVILEQQCKELYGELYQQQLYQPMESDKMKDVMYGDKSISVYKPADFKGMLVKRVKSGFNIYSALNDVNTDSYSGAWKDFGKNMRYKTSLSFMTPETLLSEPHRKR